MYCSIDDIKQEIPESELIGLTTDSGTVIDEDVIESVIDKQSSIIDDSLRSYYPVPLASTPTIIKEICIVFVKHKLFTRRGQGAATKDEYDAAETRLKNIQTGRTMLDLGTTETRPVFIKGNVREQRFSDDVYEAWP